MLLMIESGIRGGIATISHRHAKSNNAYMETEFDFAKESKFISYLDADNLYGSAMSKRLPTSGQTMLVARSSMKTSLPFTCRGQSFTLINQSMLVWAILTWVNPLCMTFITTILSLNKGIYRRITLHRHWLSRIWNENQRFLQRYQPRHWETVWH